MTFKEKHKKGIKILVLLYIVFAGCFTFPICSEQFTVDFMRVYLLVASYGVIGTSLAGVYGAKKGKVVYLFTLALTGVGLVCRYFLEFGEVSNTYNFTLVNIILYLAIIPIGTLAAYYISIKTNETRS